MVDGGGGALADGVAGGEGVGGGEEVGLGEAAWGGWKEWMRMVLNGYLEIVRYLIEHRAGVNVVDNTQQNGLHLAAVPGSISVTDLLLQHGAGVEAAYANGFRALHFAAQCGQTTFLDHFLIKYNADFNAPDNGGRTSLHWTAQK